MKQITYILAITAILFSATAVSGQKQDEKVHTTSGMHQAGDIHHHGEVMHHNDMQMGSGMEHHMDNSSMTVRESKTTSLVIDSYLKIKNALVADNGKEAALAGKGLVNAFDNFDKSSVPAVKMSELKEIIEDARENADHISENKGDIDHQREHFDLLSTDIKDLIAIAGADRTLYQIFCPMYNNGEGGMWLSANNEIKNPFYGSKMMTCGEVKTVISIQ